LGREAKTWMRVSIEKPPPRTVFPLKHVTFTLAKTYRCFYPGNIGEASEILGKLTSACGDEPSR
jgi:hypothetical protein